jgi:hypothetical protein
MLDAFGTDQRVGDFLHCAGFPAHDQYLEAVIVIQVDVQRRQDGAVEIVLQIGELFA